jgi:hypothetical protein
VQDIKTGAYNYNPLEAVIETTALVLYTYFAVRFFKSKIDFL